MRTRVTVLFVVALLLAGMPAATAAPPSHARASQPTTAEQRAAARDYWTAERRAAAVPAERLLADRPARPSTRPAAGPPAAVAPTAKGGKPGNGGGSSTGTVTGATWTGGGAVAATTGKVFFTLTGTDYVCSGSSVSSTRGDLVLTAGHCLNEGPGAFATNWVFIPAYNGDGRTATGPYGLWPATQLFTTAQWRDAGDFDYDVGFATVAAQGGQTLAQAVGAQGIAFNTARGQQVHAFGYPHASPYDGTTLTYCAGPTSNDPYGYTTQGLVCDMTGGSSGGPWYTGFDTTAGTGTAYSLNSYRYTRGPNRDRMFGPYFGTVVQNLYAAAGG